uniref:protein FAM200A-like n=1 Tax=Myxine glutinosa TaxID=7769 RepID=UPI00358F18D9
MSNARCSKISTIPLCADTIRRRIIDMGEDIEHQLYANLEANKFVIQLDESMDIAQKPLILIFVRYRHSDDFMEDLLACDELQTRTTAAEIFAVVNKHIACCVWWEHCVGIWCGIDDRSAQRCRKVHPRCGTRGKRYIA